MARGVTDEDPFAIFHAPPPNEAAGERVAREAREAEAKRVSDQIDEQLKADRVAFKKQKNVVRVLLLGQAESGKSTTLKNFRMTYARDAWNAERASWRSVIQLNLVRSILTIVETLQAEMAGDCPDEPDSSPLPNGRPYSPASPSAFTNADDIIPLYGLSSLLSDKHQLLKLRLGPLRRVEQDLKRRFGAQADEDEDSQSIPLGSLGLDFEPQVRYKEFGVSRLTEALTKSLVSRATGPIIDEATEVIASCKDDMVALWSDPAVRTVLKIWNVHLEDSAGFFLNDVERIASRTYEPSDDDVVRARLRTLGVQEYKIELTSDHANSQNVLLGTMSSIEYGREWRIYDVGGSRTARHAWLPYFDNVQVIIFLAPVSCFDQRLSEDSRVNRLADSFMLWKSICESKLLAKANTILFLNKVDLLNQKLRSGVKIKDYLPSYGERGNDAGTMIRYLRTKFKDILKHYSPEERSSYYHATTVIDTKATASTLQAVKDTILRDHLKLASFI